MRASIALSDVVLFESTGVVENETVVAGEPPRTTRWCQDSGIWHCQDRGGTADALANRTEICSWDMIAARGLGLRVALLLASRTHSLLLPIVSSGDIGRALIGH